MFWLVPGELTNNGRIEFVLSTTDPPDDCHANLFEVGDNKARRMFKDDFKRNGWSNYYWCDGSESKQLNLAVAEEISVSNQTL